VKILSTNDGLNFRSAFTLLLFFFSICSAKAATFAISSPTNGASEAYNSSVTLTIANAPAGTQRVDYYVGGTYVGTSSTGPGYSFTEIASVPGTYTITAYAYSTAAYPGGTLKGTTATITVNVYANTPTATGGSVCTSGTVTLTASATPAGGTYNWYAAATGGTALQSSTSTTYSPAVTATTTYYVSYTSGGLETSRTAVTATVNQEPNLTTMPTSGAYFSYPFSGNANDISGSGNNGTVQGGALLSTDRFGNANSAYSFNGTSQYISTATAIAAPGPQNYSISVWFKTSSAGGLLVGYTASQTGTATQYDRMIYMSNTGTLYFGIYVTSTGTATTINTTSTYADGNWHHAVATCSTSTGSCLYVDGALQASSSTMTTSETYAVNGYWRIGYNALSGWPATPTDFYFKGSLDDIATYTTALTASQVYNTYGAGSSPTCAGSTLSLQANTISGATYGWSGPSGFSSSSQNPTVSTSATTAMAGTYTCTITGATGCVSTISVAAVVNASPTSAFTATSSVLIGANATITYSGTYSATSTYTWSFNGGTIASGSGVGPYTVNWSTSGSKTVSLTVTNSSGCSSTSTQTVMVGTYGNYAFGDPLTLNTTSLGITSNLTSFPALLSIQDNNLIISGTCADKVYYPNGPNYDFAFYDQTTGSECYYQVESYNQTTGTLLVWVQIPTLTYATNKTITFYYGSTSPSTTHNTAFYQNTWASDYKAVYHFNETNYTGSTTDGTANGHTGTVNGMSATNLISGKIGNAYSFNGSSTSISNSGVNITGSFTISAWVKLSVLNLDQKVMTNQAAAGSSTGGYKLGVYSTNIPEVESPTIDRGSTPTPAAFASGAWHYIQGVYNGSSVSTYVDGSQYEIASTTTGPTSTTPFYIGVGEGGNQYYFNGTIDEVRVSNVGKTSDWIKAEYVDQNNPTTFTTVGSTVTNSTNAATISGALTYTWTGSISTDPTVAANWNNTTAGTTSQVPAFDGSATLVIPTGLTNYPSLTANASVYGLTIASGASLNLNGYTLSVGCNIYNSSGGQILYGSTLTSGITWNGATATQTYTGSSTANTAQLGNMTINNSAAGTVTIGGGPVDIYNTLTLTKGNLVISATPAALTLKSTATQTASVAAIPSTSSITGTVNVERYITGGVGYRTYRLISSPVYASTVSSNNVYSIKYLQTYVFLTGAGPIATTLFDKLGNPTLYLYREDQVPSNSTFTSGNYWGLSSLAADPSYSVTGGNPSTTASYNIPAGNGVMFFFRGNKASASLTTETQASYTTPVTVTTVTSGTLNQGQVVVHNWYTPSSANIGFTSAVANASVRGYNLVGNPYASSIDWSTFSNTASTAPIYGPNLAPTIWTFDPGTKNFATYNATTHIATLNGGKIVASGQGFFVQATAASPSLTFQESAKTSTQVTGSSLLMDTRTSLSALNQNAYGSYIRLNLITDSTNYSDVVVGFNPASSTKFNPLEDSRFVSGFGNLESISAFSSDSITTAAKWLPFPKNNLNQVTRLQVNGSASGQYTISRTELNQIPSLYEIWLMDHYKKDSLDIRNNTTYVFDINLTDTASYGSNRFSVVVREDPALMVHLLNFTANKITGGSQIVWITENEANYTNFTVERSTDGGKTYTILGGAASNDLGTYSYLDKNPVNGANMYRLQIVDLNGAVSYSSIVTLMYGTTSTLIKTGIIVYPNPANTILNLTIAPGFNSSTNTVSTEAGYEIKIANILGAVVIKTTTNQQSLQTDLSGLMPGTYIINVTNTKDNSSVGQATFIKL